MNSKNPILGKAIEWTFTDGPMAEKTFEHTFAADGSVSFRLIGGEDRGKATRVERCHIETVGEDVYAVSYVSESGYALTVVLDYRTGDLVAFASNEKGVTVQHGTFELEEGGATEKLVKPHAAKRTKKTDGKASSAAARRPS